MTSLIINCVSRHIPSDNLSASSSQQYSMVEVSRSLTKLQLIQAVFAIGNNSLQIISFTYQAREINVFVRIAIASVAMLLGLVGGAIWQASRSTVSSLYLFLFTSVLITALNLLLYFLPAIVIDILLELLTGMLLVANHGFLGLPEAIKGRSILTDLLPVLSLSLPSPTVRIMTILWPNPKLPSILTAVYCAVFTSMLIYQLNLRSISDYAQEIDAIGEELRIQKENSESSDPNNPNKNDQLSESEQAERKKYHRKFISLCVLIIFGSSMICGIES